MTNRRRYIGQQPRTKSGRRPADKPRINRGSTARCNGLHKVSFVRASEETFRTIVSDALWSMRDGCVPGEPTRRLRSCPVPPRPPALLWAAPKRSARGMSGF